MDTLFQELHDKRKKSWGWEIGFNQAGFHGKMEIDKLFRKADNFRAKFLRKYTSTLSCDFEYSTPFMIWGQQFYGTLGYENFNRAVKLISQENTHYAELSTSRLKNWKFILRYSERKNFFEKLSSTYLKENETLSTDKLSIEAAYYPSRTSLLSCELGHVDSGRADFVKFNGNKLYRLLFPQEKGKVTLQFEGKLLIPFKNKVCINDRVLCSPDSLGYEVMGHTEPSSIRDSNGREIATDDLGSKYLLRHFGYLELNNLWKLNELVPLLYWELIFYPTYKKRADLTLLEHIVQSARASSGIGIGINLNQIKLIFFWNFINFGSYKGDLERRGFGFTVSF